MKKLVLIFLITIWSVIVLDSCKSTPEDSNRLQIASNKIQIKIDSIGQYYLDKGEVLGFSIAILHENDTLYNRGFGYMDIARTNPVNPKTIFLLASISKLIGTTMVMKLVEEGKLSLDQTLYELLPDFPDQVQAEKIKLRHLLSHTSGLPEYSQVVDSAYSKTRKAPTKKEIYTILKEGTPMFEPGNDFSYNNTGFFLMGLIVEQITGNSFQSELDRIINIPTGLHLKLISENTHIPEMSPYYELHGRNLIYEPHWTWIKGDGGITATAIELAHFPILWSKGSIISDSSYHQMITPTILNDGIETGYGLGVRTGNFEGHTMLGHTGAHKTYKSKMVYFPEEQLSIAVMVNTDNTGSDANKIFGEVALAVLDKEMPDYDTVNKAIQNPVRFVGTYHSPVVKGFGTAHITYNRSDSHLYYSYYDGESHLEKMHHLGNDEYWIARWPLDRITFDIAEDGQVRALREYYTGFYVTLRKKQD